MYPLSSSSATIYIILNLWLQHPCCPKHLPHLCLHFFFPASLILLYPLSKILMQSFVCFTRRETIDIDAFLPPIYQTRNCFCHHNPVSDTADIILSVIYIILSLCCFCFHLPTTTIQSSSPVIFILHLNHNFIHCPVSLPCL